MTRVVLDTNVVVSAFLKPAGLEASVLLLALKGPLCLCVSEPVLTEYETVLYRPELRLDPQVVQKGLSDIRQVSLSTRPEHTLSVCPDESDNRFLECAGTARAEFLVTGNKRHFPKRWKTAEIVNARELIEKITPGRE